MDIETQTFGGSVSGKRSWFRAFLRGASKRCPQCGAGRIFAGYTTTRATCDVCHLDLSGHRADDAPPYLTIMVVGHLLIPLALATRQMFEPPLWAQFAFWTPALILATIWMLPVSKGAMIGIQWANRMHGFAGHNADPKVDA